VIHRRFERDVRAGGTLRGDVRLPERASPRSAVVLVHGFKGFKDWGFFPHLARSLVADGHAVVSFNFSGSGLSDGSSDEVTDLDAFAANTFTRELEELDQLMGLVRAGEFTPKRPVRVGLMGHSRGGGDAILYAGGRGGVDALVTWGAVASFDRWSEETKREWRERGRIWVVNTRTGQRLPLDVSLLDDFEGNRERLEVLAAARAVSAPWLIVHGAEDLTVDVADAHLLAGAAPGARLLLVEAAGHTFEVAHPLAGPTPNQLDQAVVATAEHFGRWLGDPSGAAG